MAVSIDSVYQKVLALANKEQRGYITPLEFNLLANQAQDIIFEQYFYEIKQWNDSGSGNSTNIIKAIKYANSKKAISIGLTGMGGGKMKNLSDVCLTVNSDNMLAIESTHLALCHCIITSIRSMGKPLFKYE